MPCGDPHADGQAHARAGILGSAVKPLERLEDSLDVTLVNANAVAKAVRVRFLEA